MAAQTYKSVTTLFGQSREAVLRNLSAFIIVNLATILGLAWNLGDSWSGDGGNRWKSVAWPGLFGGNSDIPAGAGILAFVFVLASIILALMNIILSLRVARKKVVPLGEVWQEFTAKAWRLLGVVILTAVIIVVGFILLIVPGVIFLGRLYLAPYILVDQNTGIREALDRSWAMTKSRMWQVYSVILFAILLSFTNIIPLVGGLIAFVLVMLYSVAAPLRYYELKGKTAA